MVPVWDMLIYLGCTQLLLLSRWHFYITENTDRINDNQIVFLLFSIATTLFWLVWGGYSVDAWRYLSRFDFNPLHFQEERLFWTTGYLLNKLVPDPWPIKILSAISILVLTWSYFRYYSNAQRGELLIAYALLLATPAYFLLLGNTVRQGIAGCIEILGAVFFLQKRYWTWAVIAVAGYMLHQFGAIVALAVLISRLFSKYLLWIWIVSFLVSPVSTYVLHLFGFNLEELLRYGDYTEGQFHWAKAIVSFIITSFILFSFKFQPSVKIDFRHIYIAINIISNTVLLYEVPFERLFLFSDLIAPLALGQVFARINFVKKYSFTLSLIVILFSVILWSNYSIVKSLGYL